MREPSSRAGRPLDLPLEAWLRAARQLGFLGPAPIDSQLRHSMDLAGAVPEPPSRVLELGAGGGVPGLALAHRAWPGSRWVLVEANERRAAFLKDAVDGLDLTARVEVVAERAEATGRWPSLRHQFDLVLARSFARPGVTAECAAPFLSVGGLLVVSEPPAGGLERRWPVDGLAKLNLALQEVVAEPVHAVVLRSAGPCDQRYPRRVGIPRKRPLF